MENAPALFIGAALRSHYFKSLTIETTVKIVKIRLNMYITLLKYYVDQTLKVNIVTGHTMPKLVIALKKFLQSLIF